MKTIIMSYLLILVLHWYPVEASEPGMSTPEGKLNWILERQPDANGKPFISKRGSSIGRLLIQKPDQVRHNVSGQTGNFGAINLVDVEHKPIEVIRALLTKHKKRMYFTPGYLIRIRDSSEQRVGFEQVIDGVPIDHTNGSIRYVNGEIVEFHSAFVEPRSLKMPDVDVTQVHAETVALEVLQKALANYPDKEQVDRFLNNLRFESLLRYSFLNEEAYWDVKLYKLNPEPGDTLDNYWIRVYAAESLDTSPGSTRYLNGWVEAEAISTNTLLFMAHVIPPKKQS